MKRNTIALLSIVCFITGFSASADVLTSENNPISPENKIYADFAKEVASSHLSYSQEVVRTKDGAVVDVVVLDKLCQVVLSHHKKSPNELQAESIRCNDR